MANIVISMYNYVTDPQNKHALPPFYETFIAGLIKHGNNILCLHHNEIKRSFEEPLPKKIKAQLDSFKPELFIFFNNNFWDVSSYFDSPIVIYDVDSPNLYVNKKALTKNINRFIFLVNQSSGTDIIKSTFGVDTSKVRYIKPFTEIQTERIDPVTNIVFCGSHWLWSGCEFIYDFMKMSPNRTDRILAQQILKAFINDPFKSSVELYAQLGLNPLKKMRMDVRMASGRLSGVKRARYLTEISDLGLEIRGNYWNHPSLNLFPKIALCYNDKVVASLAATQKMYNAAKIGININHIQAKTGFSWRVCDIMASNACLVAEYTPDLENLFSGTNVPTFTSPAEARAQCVRVIEDENYRLDVVEKAHEIINKHHRFINALEDIEEFLNMNLRTGKEGLLKFIKDVPVSKKNISSTYTTFEKANNKHLSIFRRAERKLWYILGQNLKKNNII